jgi:hypothetical protein
MRLNYGIKSVHKRTNRYRPLIPPPRAMSAVHVLKTQHPHQQHHQSPHPKTRSIQSENLLYDEQSATNRIIVEQGRISQKPKFPCRYVEPAMKSFEDDLLPLKMVNFQDDIINVVFVVRRVRSPLRRQVFTFSRIGHIVNDIIMNLIILRVGNVVKVLKDNVYNLKMLQFDILPVLLVMYFALCTSANYRNVTLNLMKIISSRMDRRIANAMLEL